MAEILAEYAAEPFDYAEARVLAAELEVSEPVAITLVRRGFRTAAEARAFLDAEETHPPGAFGSMAAAVELVGDAIGAGSRITVHGDFDVDGVCATTILVAALRRLGAECDWLIPDRLGDGYGLSADNVRKLAERGTELLITVDCGITAVEEIALANSLGMETIVTDHHQPGEELPGCLILHPSIDGYPFEHLCGTAVAWKFALALEADADGGAPGSRSRGVPGAPPSASVVGAGASGDIDLVALATVADLVPLVGENRALVRKGLTELRRSGRIGMRALIEAAKCDPNRLDESDLGFRLAPRINAAGRLYRADAGVELFLTDDEERAAQIAAELGRANAERRDTERRVSTEAEAALRELPDEVRAKPAIVVAGGDWHPGVVGIVASRLVEHHHRPAVVISLDGEGGARGSARSISGFDMLAALEACAEHLERFGGHRAAAGLELRADAVDAFRAAFVAHAEAVISAEDLVRTERIDAIVGGAGLGLELAEELERLAPFGMGNPGVRLLVPSARIRDVRAMGEGKHSRFNLHSGSHRAVGIAFGRSSLGVGEEDTVDAAVRLEVNRWNGSVEPRLVLRELYPREGPATPATGGAEAWWERFEAERERPADADPVPAAPAGLSGERLRLTGRTSAAALLAELAASRGGPVLAIVADRRRRRPLGREGVELADAFDLCRNPELAAGFEHVVIADPPASAALAALAAVPWAVAGGYLHSAWGEGERALAVSALDDHLVRREALAALFRDLRAAGEVGGDELLAALRGAEPRPRAPEVAARGLRVLTELGIVAGEAAAGDGSLGVVSSEAKQLELSPAYVAYGVRHQEAVRYLEQLRKQ